MNSRQNVSAANLKSSSSSNGSVITSAVAFFDSANTNDDDVKAIKIKTPKKIKGKRETSMSAGETNSLDYFRPYDYAFRKFSSMNFENFPI